MLRSGRAVASYLATPRLRTLPLKINPVHTGFTFAAHFLMLSQCAGSILEQNIAFVLTEFGKQVVAEPPQPLPGGLLMFNCTFIQAFIADSGMNFVQWVTQHFPPFSVNFTAHFHLNSQAHVVMFSLQFSGIQKPTSQGMATPRLRSGGHQTDSKPASVLAN